MTAAPQDHARQTMDRQHGHLVDYAIARGADKECATEAVNELWAAVVGSGERAPPLSKLRRAAASLAREMKRPYRVGSRTSSGAQTGISNMIVVADPSDMARMETSDAGVFDERAPRYYIDPPREGLHRCDGCGVTVRYVALSTRRGGPVQKRNVKSDREQRSAALPARIRTPEWRKLAGADARALVREETLRPEMLGQADTRHRCDPTKRRRHQAMLKAKAAGERGAAKARNARRLKKTQRVSVVGWSVVEIRARWPLSRSKAYEAKARGYVREAAPGDA